MSDKIKWRCFPRDGFEPYDIIATVATKMAARGGGELILSTDRNYCQLLGGGIAVFDHFAQRPLNREMVVKKFQVQPRQLPEFLALAGDSGASIPGVRSVGARTAAQLLGAHGVGVIIEAKHMCMMMRGAQKQNSVTTTSMMLGRFRADHRTRAEFLTLVGH